MKKTGNKGLCLRIFAISLAVFLMFAACSNGEDDTPTPKTIAVTGVSLKPSTSLLAGGTETLTAEITPSDATNKSVTWSSSNTAVATVSTGGVVTGVSAGTAIISVTTVDGGKTATCTVTVSTTAVAVTGVSLKASIDLLVGDTETLTAIIIPSEATNQNVTWNSSNTAVATVSEGGVVTGISAGTAIISVATVDGGKTAFCNVTVVATGAELPALTGTVSISGTAEVEQTLTAVTTSLGGDGDISYQWKRGSTSIGTDNNTYQVQSADMGSTITVTVTRSGNSGSVTSAPTAVVIAELPPTPGLAFTLMGSYYSVSRGTANAAEVIIPAVYEGKPVTMIESNGFSSYTNMTSIRIPDRITSIGSNAFSNCTALASVIIPNSVTSISTNAFTGCTALTSITIPFFGPSLNGTYPIGYLFGTNTYNNQNDYIPASLRTVIITGGNSVPANAFNGCTRLTSVTIPESVLSIGQNAFNGCTGLTSVTIGNGVTSIGQSAFSGCSSLANVTIPESVLSIGQNAFYGCTGLTGVTIGNGVTSIGQSAFYGCSSLANVNIPDSVTSIGQNAFSGCTSPSSITIPNSMTSIGQNAFSGWSGLTSVTIGSSVTSIGDSAFSYCSGLTNISIPDSVTSIGDSAFRNCTSLKSITIPFINRHLGFLFETSSGSYYSINSPSEANYRYYEYVTSGSYSGLYRYFDFYIPTSLKTVVITTGVDIGGFSNCTDLTSITIPDSVTSIAQWAFYGCSGLTSVTIPDSVTSIGQNAFYGCTSPSSVTIPNSMTSIGQRAFSGWSGLTSVTIGDRVTDIGDSAFSGCRGLTSITISNNVTSIGSSAFSGCRGLTSITIPNNVTSIGSSAFSGCSGLTSITIPNNVTSIGSSAFSGLSGLLSINFNATNCTDLPVLTDNNREGVFENAGQNAAGVTVNIGANVTKIPANLFSSYYDYYYSSGKLKIIAVNFAAGSVCQSIGAYAFSNCTSLTSITIPNSVTSIGQRAFSDCTGLTSITIPFVGATLNGTSNTVFYYIFGSDNKSIPSSLKTVIITGGSITSQAFYGCTGLTSVTIGNNVTSIGGSAFYGCSGLTSVIIPNSVTSIGDYAFCYTGLTSVIIPNSVTSIGDSAFWTRSLISVTFATGSNISDNNFGNDAFADSYDGNTLKTAYSTGKAGTYMLISASYWIKQ